jgi:RNA polymerase sigma factor (sigma-70 family)
MITKNPKPEEDLLSRYLQNRDVNLRNELIERYYSLALNSAKYIAKRLPSNVQQDDLLGAAHESIINAIETYETGRGMTLKSHIATKVRRGILDELRKTHGRNGNRRSKHPESLDKKIDRSENSGYLKDRIPDHRTQDPRKSVEDKEAIKKALSHIQPDHRLILVLRYGHSFDFSEIASVLGFSETSVFAKRNSALKALRSRPMDL